MFLLGHLMSRISYLKSLRVNASKNQRLSKKSRTRSKIDLAHVLPVGSLI